MPNFLVAVNGIKIQCRAGKIGVGCKTVDEIDPRTQKLVVILQAKILCFVGHHGKYTFRCGNLLLEINLAMQVLPNFSLLNFLFLISPEI